MAPCTLIGFYISSFLGLGLFRLRAGCVVWIAVSDTAM
jgi:hypothetical protein